MTSRRPDWLPPRKNFPRAIIKAVWLRAGGVCEVPECNAPGCDVDHIFPDGLGGSNTADNAMLLCRPCHKAKTDADKAAIAKADRAGGRSGQTKRRAAAKERGTHRAIPQRKNPWPSGRKFQRGK